MYSQFSREMATLAVVNCECYSLHFEMALHVTGFGNLITGLLQTGLVSPSVLPFSTPGQRPDG
jgi:hypothetical protein